MNSNPTLPRGNACLVCRKKKTKCDGAKPTCNNCGRSGKACLYNEPPKSQTQLLREKISTLEEKIASLENPSQSSSSSSRGSNSTPSPPHGGSRYANSITDSPPRSHTTVPGANGMVWSPQVPFNGRVTPELRDRLVRVFLANMDKCCLDVSANRLLSLLSLQPEDPRAPHPAFVQAIMLLGCYYLRLPSLGEYEDLFLQNACDQIQQSFNQADKLHDHVRASNLVAFYLLYKGCIQDAQTYANMGGHVALSCNLHQISSPVWRPSTSADDNDMLIPYPRDPVELGERIHTWWQTFILDKLLSMICGRAPALSNGLEANGRTRITTPWPRLMSEYETGRVSDVEVTTVGHLYSNYVPSPYARRDTLAGLQSQAVSLMAKACQAHSNPSDVQDLRLTDNSIQVFLSRLPDIRASGESGETPGQRGASVNPQLAHIHTLAHAASLILHQRATDMTSHHRCATATQAMTNIITELRDRDYQTLFFGIGHVWQMSANVLLKLWRSSLGPAADSLQRDMHTLMMAIRRLSFVYPALGFQLQSLEQSIR